MASVDLTIRLSRSPYALDNSALAGWGVAWGAEEIRPNLVFNSFSPIPISINIGVSHVMLEASELWAQRWSFVGISSYSTSLL